MIRLTRPVQLLFLALAYTLGVAIADYLGAVLVLSTYLLGLLGLCVVQVSMNLLVEVFRPANEPILPDQPRAERVYLRDRLLVIAIGLIAIAAGLVFLLYLSDRFSFSVLIVLAFSLLILLAYAVPPFQLARRGFGEFLLALHIGYVAPSLGFVLQVGKFHRLLPIVALPVTMLIFVYFLVLDFPSFADDIKYERLTLLTRLGWQRAVPIHHALLLAVFVLFALTPLFHLSPALILPVIVAVPFAFLQAILIRNIALGLPPLWKPLSALAAILIILTTYLLAYSFFTH
jgi:1,4-dihydroxy-2-naphthoate octaprenyltransferase